MDNMIILGIIFHSCLDLNGLFSFVGGLLGSGLMAAVTLVVLNRQLQQNHEENERNRCNNDANIKWQQENLKQDRLIDAVSNYLVIYNTNDFIEIVKKYKIAPETSEERIKELYNKSKILKIRLDFILKDDEIKKTLDYTLGQYTEVVDDVKYFISYCIAKKNGSAKSFMDYCDGKISQDMKDELSKCKTYTIADIIRVINSRIDKISDLRDNKVEPLLRKYIEKEQKRINDILLQQ